jgi:uncharacterized cupredoxin-like copper-binding protein
MGGDAGRIYTLGEIRMNKTWFVAGYSVLALTACAGIEKPSAPAVAGPNIVNVTTTEYAFDMPDTLPAGPTLFHLTDNGTELHHMTLVKFKQGKTLADFTALPPGAPPPSWAVFMGGPNTPPPNGGQDEAAVDLAPGNYAVICVIPGPDGKPHFMHGMVKALTVTAATAPRTMPASDMTLSLTNYAFTFSAPPTMGSHVIRIVNNGTQPHEAVLFRMESGRIGKDVAMWVSTGMQGPPPGVPVAGVSLMAPGQENTLPVTLTPGAYALLCFAPDAGDGKPHALHGMIHDFKVM